MESTATTIEIVSYLIGTAAFLLLAIQNPLFADYGCRPNTTHSLFEIVSTAYDLLAFDRALRGNLAWAAYNAGKKSVELDWSAPHGRAGAELRAFRPSDGPGSDA